MAVKKATTRKKAAPKQQAAAPPVVVLDDGLDEVDLSDAGISWADLAAATQDTPEELRPVLIDELAEAADLLEPEDAPQQDDKLVTQMLAIDNARLRVKNGWGTNMDAAVLLEIIDARARDSSEELALAYELGYADGKAD